MAKKSRKKVLEGANLKPQAKRLNPFELHINRKKYDVLGMKSKADRGLPGISRERSLKKRKRTLLQEYKVKDKKNLFWDRRIGERNSAMTAEDKIIARYTAERMKAYSKKSIFNLGDDEELTHKGQTLTEIEKFDDPKSDDDDDDEKEDGRLDSAFVEDAHFGGGIFKKVDGESKSRKTLIDELISESIKRKAEKQKIRQQTFDMTEKLDSDWKELLPLVTATKKSKLDSESMSNKDDKFATYDALSKKLKFEARGKPSDRLKSEEEIAKEEKEKLEHLENERIQRMLESKDSKTRKHRSADDMDDGFLLEDETESILTYQNGVLNTGNTVNNESDVESTSSETEDKDYSKKLNSKNSDEEDESMSKNSESNDGKENSSDNEGNQDIVNDEDNDYDENNGTEAENENEDDDDNNDDDDEEDNEDSYSDLQESDESDVDMSATNISAQKNENNGKNSLMPEILNENVKDTENEETKAAVKELPFTFQIPKDYDEFENLMKNYNANLQAVIIERMIKCHHPSLKEEHKNDLDLLFTFLLQHIQDSASDNSTNINCFKILDKLAPWLFDLVQWNPDKSSVGLIEVIKEKYKDFLKNSRSYPSLDTLIFLKLVSILFPTSDFRHPVVTPTIIFMQEILFQCKILSSIDLSSGLFITTLLFEYCALSKRFVPEAINFLYCVLRLAQPKNSSLPIRLPLQQKTIDLFNINVVEKARHKEFSQLSIRNLIQINSSEEFKVNAVALALNLLSEFCNFWEEGQSAILVFEPFIPLLDSNVFSDCLKEASDKVLAKILKFKNENLKMLVLQKKKPKPLRLYEPNIEEVYSFKKHRPMGKKKAERAKLLHKYKREMKGALREIRRDRSFLHKLKYKETVKSDMERKRKVQEIFSSAAEQQGELRKIARKKK